MANNKLIKDEHLLVLINELFANELSADAYQAMMLDKTKMRAYYQLYQPTGLIYGVHVLEDFPYSHYFKTLKKGAQQIGVLISALFPVGLSVANNKLLFDKVVAFYDTIYPNNKSIFKFYSISKPNNSSLYKKLAYRLGRNNNINRFFNITYQFNPLLFLDVLLFNKWINNESCEQERLKLYIHKLYLLVIDTIIAASQANGNVGKYEKRVINGFLKSAQFSKSDRTKIRKRMNKTIDLDGLDFALADNWLISKYLLEISIFVLFTDRMLEPSEQVFISKLAAKLNLDDAETEASLLAVESFMLKNWNNLKFLRYKSHSSLIYGDLKNRMLSIGNKYKHSFITEIQESKELMHLINKSRTENLTDEEKEKVKQQLIDIFKTIPALSVVLLPGGTVILFILYEILPKELLPSGFKDYKQKEK